MGLTVTPLSQGLRRAIGRRFGCKSLTLLSFQLRISNFNLIKIMCTVAAVYARYWPHPAIVAEAAPGPKRIFAGVENLQKSSI